MGRDAVASLEEVEDHAVPHYSDPDESVGDHFCRMIFPLLRGTLSREPSREAYRGEELDIYSHCTDALHTLPAKLSEFVSVCNEKCFGSPSQAAGLNISLW